MLGTRSAPLHHPLLPSLHQNAYLECGGFCSKLLEARHVRRNILKISFHLLAKTYIETANVRETRNPEIEVENMEPVTGKHFTEKSRLYAQLHEDLEAETKTSRTKDTLPTALAPKNTVNDGSPSRARSITRNSASRGRKPGRRATACLMRSRGGSRSSAISLRASSSWRLDSVSERAVSEGWMGHERSNQAS